MTEKIYLPGDHIVKKEIYPMFVTLIVILGIFALFGLTWMLKGFSCT